MRSENNNQKFHPKLPKFISMFDGFLTNIRIPSKVIFVVIGLLSTIWFLVRVIPKPSRASYPCMKAAYPFISGFIAYLAGLTATVFAFRKSKKHFANARYLAAIVFLCIAFFAAVFTSTDDPIPVYANSKLQLGPNQPIGTAKGIFPGRVVWVWDPSATNENCTNTYGDGWFMDKNTDKEEVYSMVSDAVKKLTGKATVGESWDALFKYFNKNHGKGATGYKTGEKVFIRTNQVSASSGTYDENTFAIKNQKRYGMAETSPQVVLAILRHLVNECGVKQEDISIGDPMKHMYKHVYDMYHDEFPDVVCIDTDARLGRTSPVKPADPSIYYSDRGTILKEDGTSGKPVTSDYFPTVITEADYMIVIPALKAHARGGVTLNAKIHFGSNLYGSATHLHGGLIAPNKENADPMRTGYGLYRVQVDLMGDKYLGGNTLLFIVDGLWGGSEANDPPRKFMMQPFNNDWTSSVFMSQDQVALESVCFDFLKAEYTADRVPFYGDYPQMEGADDYINQAADSSYWPIGFTYDPENDGTPIHSLGVCEHWNNPVDKFYSRNMNKDNGIELVEIKKSETAVSTDNTIPSGFRLLQNYPNPFNPATSIRYSIPAGLKRASADGQLFSSSYHTTLKIYDMLGREVAMLVNGDQMPGDYVQTFDAGLLPSGVYFYSLMISEHYKTNSDVVFSESKKMILLK